MSWFAALQREDVNHVEQRCSEIISRATTVDKFGYGATLAQRRTKNMKSVRNADDHARVADNSASDRSVFVSSPSRYVFERRSTKCAGTDTVIGIANAIESATSSGFG